MFFNYRKYRDKRVKIHYYSSSHQYTVQITYPWIPFWFNPLNIDAYTTGVFGTIKEAVIALDSLPDATPTPTECMDFEDLKETLRTLKYTHDGVTDEQILQETRRTSH